MKKNAPEIIEETETQTYVMGPNGEKVGLYWDPEGFKKAFTEWIEAGRKSQDQQEGV